MLSLSLSLSLSHSLSLCSPSLSACVHLVRPHVEGLERVVDALSLSPSLSLSLSLSLSFSLSVSLSECVRAPGPPPC